jgi:UDP-N-acetylglucosamine acyltransferase
MGSALTKNIRPFTIFVANKPPRVNHYAIQKFGFQEHVDQITRYVQEGVLPSADLTQKLIDEFERVHIDSKRPLYK